MSELPEGWAATPVKQLLTRTSSLDPSKFPLERFELWSVPSFATGNPETLLGQEIKSSKQIVQKGDVLLCKIVPHINRVWTIETDSNDCRIASGEWIVLRDHGCEPKYLRYCLSAPDFRAEFLQTVSGVGGSLMRARPSEVAEILVPIAPKAEQRRIVEKLDALTARAARARADLDRIPALAARYRLSLLRKAARGGLTEGWRQGLDLESADQLVSRTPAPDQGRGGRAATSDIQPGQAGLSINDPGTKAPEGWAWIPLLRIARQETGHTPSRSKSSYWDGNVPWVGIKDAGSHHGRTIDRTLQTITEDGLANSSARLLPEGTVCLSRTASVGYVTILGRPMATSQDFATWTCSEALLPEYLMFALMAEGDDIRDFGEGTTHTTIYFPEIRALTICLPPLAEQQEIVERVKQSLADIDRMVTEAAAARRLLDRLDQAVLAKAFRGELVPQDPSDEPASVLLDRISAERAAAPKAKRGRRKAAA